MHHGRRAGENGRLPPWWWRVFWLALVRLCGRFPGRSRTHYLDDTAAYNLKDPFPVSTDFRSTRTVTPSGGPLLHSPGFVACHHTPPFLHLFPRRSCARLAATHCLPQFISPVPRPHFHSETLPPLRVFLVQHPRSIPKGGVSTPLLTPPPATESLHWHRGGGEGESADASTKRDRPLSPTSWGSITYTHMCPPSPYQEDR